MRQVILKRLRAAASRPTFRGAHPHGPAPGTNLSADASRAAEQSRPRQGFGFAQPRSPASPRFASRLPSVLRRRCFSPTSATNTLHVHPWIGRLPSFAARAATTTRWALPPSRPLRASSLKAWRAAPDRLATIRPQVSTRLTARAQLRPSHAQPPSRIESSFEGRAPPTGRRPRCHGVFGREQGRRENL